MVLSLERWLGKVAIVTGANSGIGAATALRLAEEGIIVVGLDIATEKIEENSEKLANKNGKLHAVKVDLTNEEEITNAFKWTTKNVGPVSILINNAGIFVQSSMLNGAVEDWKKVLDINLIGHSIVAREAIKTMREHNIDGHIVNIASGAAHKVLPNLNMYAPSKFAVRAATESFRLELNALNSKIKIGYVSPGAVNTSLLRNVINDERVLKRVDQFSMKPEEVANAIVYILSTPPHVQIQELIIKPQCEA